MKRSDVVIPLDRTAAGRMMTWSIAVLVYLAVLALAVAGAAHQLLGAAAENANVAIVSLPPPLDASKAEGDLAAVTALLLADPDIVRVDRIPAAEVSDLLGQPDGTTLPLPSLLELRFRPALEPDFTRVTGLVRSVVPDAVVEDAGKAGGARIDVAESLRLLGTAAAIMFLAAAIALVVAVIRSAVRHQDETVDLLRMLGASDRFLARQFQRHVLHVALRGGLIGFAAAAVTIVVLLDAGGLLELPGLASLTAMPTPWILLAAVPLVMVLLLTAIGRVTAGLALRHLD
ncbi:MAG TPA: FtsX-like permease family protein [Geminicoccus sp.]|jgi:cell division transport system permease protein|uniref:FtsX-like permease family protein n=1 Tax=Geminicoccus sp. TaxID=2024832 RepID=UPI002E33431C|nr:FtsX-like permease family protein [Geminicoccus sp.]HEX2526994.1 FtsX-like permease family protein [Geminicoccus sp.]